jgi:hypothetical protein
LVGGSRAFGGSLRAIAPALLAGGSAVFVRSGAPAVVVLAASLVSWAFALLAGCSTAFADSGVPVAVAAFA